MNYILKLNSDYVISLTAAQTAVQYDNSFKIDEYLKTEYTVWAILSLLPQTFTSLLMFTILRYIFFFWNYWIFFEFMKCDPIYGRSCAMKIRGIRLLFINVLYWDLGVLKGRRVKKNWLFSSFYILKLYITKTYFLKSVIGTCFFLHFLPDHN